MDDPVLTIKQHTRVREALHVVYQGAEKVARRFARYVQGPEDLWAAGTFELHRAVVDFDESYNHTFADYARRRVRCAMVKSLGLEIFEDRIHRAVDIATDQFWAYLVDRDYDASRHDEDEARGRLRVIANGMLGGAFMAAVEEAHRITPDEETAERQEYEIAVVALRAALPKLGDRDRGILTALYRDLMSSREASVELSIPYGSFKRYHAAALAQLHKQLLAQGVTQAPRPRVVYDPGGVLGLPASAPQNDGGPPR
jgi:RNA polymerase sigma factor (sigma-70 family)